MRGYWVIIALAGPLLAGCATSLQLRAAPEADQTTIFENGSETIISKRNVLVAVRPVEEEYKSDTRPTFVVTVFNSTRSPFNFSTGNITAWVNTDPSKVFTYEELVAEVKKRKMWKTIAAAVAGGARGYSAGNAGYQYHSGTVSGSYYGNYYSGDYSGYTYDPAAASRAQAAASAQTGRDMDAIDNAASDALSKLDKTILRKHTVMPRSWHGGYVKINKTPVPEQSNNIYIVVTVVGEVHYFKFVQSKAK